MINPDPDIEQLKDELDKAWVDSWKRAAKKLPYSFLHVVAEKTEKKINACHIQSKKRL